MRMGPLGRTFIFAVDTVNAISMCGDRRCFLSEGIWERTFSRTFICKMMKKDSIVDRGKQERNEKEETFKTRNKIRAKCYVAEALL